MSNVNNEKVAATVNALNNKFENKVANKKNNIDGDYSDDNVSYPTVQAVKGHFGQKMTQWNATPLNANYPSEKLVKDSLDELETDMTIDVVKQATADTGYASTYYITQGGVQVGAKIQVMKDKMVRSASVETVGATPTQDETDNGLDTGERYILLVVNTADNDSATNLIIPITDSFDLQKGDDTSIVLNSNGIYSVKEGYVEGIIDDYLDAFINAL